MRCRSCAHDNRAGARFCEECGAPLADGSDDQAAATPEAVGGGRFRLTRLLGEGARKRVYAAVDSRLGREVAVAVVKTDDLDAAGRQRIEREAAAMARLGDHAHIVTVFDVGEDAGQPYIVSQLMPGGSVADQLSAAPDHRLPVRQALDIAVQVGEALAHAHVHGVVHRDLKPANVWVSGDGSVLLGDFGLAAVTDHSRLTAEGLVVGTVAYLAPEQAVGRPPDTRSDLYSLGATLYELLCGRPPFLGDDAVAVISQHLNTPPVAPSWHNAEVGPALDALVLRLLAKSPEDRPAAARAVVEELQRIGEVSVEVPDAPSAAATRLLTFGRLIGRGTELGQLTGAYDAAVSGDSRVVLVVGEPGIGKTRLVEELAVYASVRGASVCWGHCYEGEIGMPYLPFIEAFRAYVRERSDDELRVELSAGAPEVATLVSEIGQRLADLPTLPPLEGDAERMRLFEGATTFLRNASAVRPVVLLIDDLHWADKPSLLMLQYLARNLRRERVLIVGTYRDVELDRTHPLAEALGSLRRERLYERVLLRGLPASDVKALIDAIDDQDSPPAFAEAIHRETEGNPFFIAEILRNLVETGAISKVDGRWVGSPDALAEHLPEGVREVIGRRLSRLSEDCNRMLTVAAAMPGGFSPDVVSSVIEADEDRILDLLDEALAAQVLRERREALGTYEFGHALIRQTLYGELSTPRRVRLHRQIAAAIEGRGSTDADLGALAYHWFQGAPGGDIDKAVEYSTRAADRARAQAAHEEAARFYDMALQALDLAEGTDARRRAELLLALGEAHLRAGDSERAQVVLREAADIARGLGDAGLLARVALVTSGWGWGGGVARPDLTSLLAEAAERLGDADDVLLARLKAREANFYLFLDNERQRSVADEAVTIARRSGDPGALATALSVWSWGLAPAERGEEMRDVYGEIGRLAELAGDHDLALANVSSLAIVALVDGDRDGIDSYAAQHTRLAKESRSPWHLASAACLQGALAVLDGRYEEAERLASEVLDYGRRLADRSYLNTFGILVLPMWRERGRSGEFESATRRAVEASPTVGGWRAGLAQILCDMGRYDDAAKELEVVAADHFAAIADDVASDHALCATAEVVAVLGDAERAEELAPLLRPRTGRCANLGSTAFYGAVDRYLGLLELTTRRHDEAVAWLESALAIHERVRARPWCARTRYDLARALLERAATGDRERAVGLLNDALQTANEIGMPVLVEQALALKLTVQGVASSSPAASIDVVAAKVSMEQPDLTPDTGADGMVAIVFSDIEGYTGIVERLGDAGSQELLRAHDDLVRVAVTACGGRVVKSQGDGFMLAFSSPAAAVECAVRIQRAVAGHDFGAEEVRLRVGVHVGDVIRQGDDFYGRTVIVAARVAASASGGEILVTDAVKAGAAQARFGEERQVVLKGLSGSHAIHCVEWRQVLAG